ncbi:hypothetical protein C8D77_101712 [Mesorhizobium loti]|uniref:Uncharacterized protein n=1 Tax=Rhizobium loti TaxID=381 RepID=A0A8E2WJC1_RHILI|nr:hypothetical protein C8D77_101712 [Mesorhizobium loti]
MRKTPSHCPPRIGLQLDNNGQPGNPGIWRCFGESILSLRLRAIPLDKTKRLDAIERSRRVQLVLVVAVNPHCFCSISICFVMRTAFCA